MNGPQTVVTESSAQSETYLVRSICIIYKTGLLTYIVLRLNRGRSGTTVMSELSSKSSFYSDWQATMTEMEPILS